MTSSYLIGFQPAYVIVRVDYKEDVDGERRDDIEGLRTAVQ